MKQATKHDAIQKRTVTPELREGGVYGRQASDTDQRNRQELWLPAKLILMTSAPQSLHNVYNQNRAVEKTKKHPMAIDALSILILAGLFRQVKTGGRLGFTP